MRVLDGNPRVAGDGIKAPQLAAGDGIVGCDVTADAELGAAIAATCIGAPPVFYQGCETLLELKKPIAQLLGFSSNFNAVCNEIQVRVCVCFVGAAGWALRARGCAAHLPLSAPFSQLCWTGLMWLG